MIPMNFMKSKAGFTLVELLVVIAILAILAGIAVPAYSGYIKKAESAADISTCDAIKTAAQSALAVYGEVIEVKITSGTVTAKYNDGTDDIPVTLTNTVDGETYDDDFQMFYTSEVPTSFADSKTTATWTSTANSWSFS